MINMITERLLPNGEKLKDFEGTEHGWPSVQEGTDGLCKRWGDSVIRLPNGCEDKDFSRSTGIKLRVTFYEVGQ